MIAAARIALAQLRSAGATLILLAVIVALAASIVVVAPIALTHATSLELRASISELSEERRDPTGQINDLAVIDLPVFRTEPSTIETTYGSLLRALEDARQEQPEPLRSTLGEAQIVIIGTAVRTVAPEPEADDPAFDVRTIVDPRLDERVRVIDGRLPEPWVSNLIAVQPGSPSSLNTDPPPATPVELVLTADGADALRWSIGEIRTDPAGEYSLVLVGIVEPADLDADAAYWRGIPGAPESERFDDGNSQPRETAAAFVHPLTVGAPTAFGPITVWYPLDVSQLDASTIELFLPQLRSFLSTGIAIPAAIEGLPSTSAIVTSEIPDAVDEVLQRSSVTTALLALMITGPLGTLAVVLLLASRSTIDRRRAVLALQLARGASRTRLRLVVVRDALAVTVPAMLIGCAAGLVMVGPLTGLSLTAAAAALMSSPASLVLAAVALLPALLLAAFVPHAADLRDRRADLARPGRGRALAELIVVTLAALSVWLLLQRGIVTSASAVGVDPLLVAMPLLVALAASALTARAYPALLAVAQRIVGRVGSAVSVIGARRASRERTVGLPVVVATVIAASVAVSSLSLLAVLDAGLDRTARDERGASVSISGPGVDAELLVAMQNLPGASVAGGIDVVGPAVLSVDGVRENATVLTIDEASARLRDDAPADWPPASATPPGDRVPVMLSDDLVPSGDGGAEPDITVDGVPVVVVATGRVSAGYGSARSWVLVGEADAALFSSQPAVDTVIIEPSPGVSPTDLGRAATDLANALGATQARIAVAAADADAQRNVPLTAALRVTLIGVSALAAMLAIVTVATAAVVGRPRRQQVQGIARVLGMPRTSSLVAWELAPPAMLGTVVGGLVGIALVPLATAAIDLRFITGSADPLEASVNAALIGGVMGALALGVLIVVAGATTLDRRPSMLTTLRTESS